MPCCTASSLTSQCCSIQTLFHNCVCEDYRAFYLERPSHSPIVAISSKSVVSLPFAPSHFPTRSACTPAFVQDFASCHWSSTPLIGAITQHRSQSSHCRSRARLSALRDTEYNLPPIVKRVTADRHQTWVVKQCAALPISSYSAFQPGPATQSPYTWLLDISQCCIIKACRLLLGIASLCFDSHPDDRVCKLEGSARLFLS